MRSFLMIISIYLSILIFVGTILFVVITQPFVSPVQLQNSIEVSQSNLKDHVVTLSAQLPPRNDKNLDKCAAYIRKHLAKTTANVKDQEYTIEGKTFRNIIATFGPDTTERVIVGAHYDSFQGMPGADDNASGVAGLLELARHLNHKSFTLGVDIVAYSLEEVPYFRSEDMGSARHAAFLVNKGYQVKLMIALEMIGFYSNKPESQRYPMAWMKYYYPTKGDFIAVVGELNRFGLIRRVKQQMMSATNLPVYSINAPALVPGIDFSDHLNYWNHGFAAIMVTDTAFYRNSNYHTTHDTADTLDYDNMAKVIQGVYQVLVDQAGIKGDNQVSN